MVHLKKKIKSQSALSLKALYKFPIIIIIVSEVKWVRQLTSETAGDMCQEVKWVTVNE